MARSLTTSLNTLTTVAGAGCSGNTASTLNSPRGIFVDIDLNLYVADCNNNRIQRFQSASSNAITVAGTGSINVTIDLNNPVAIVLDADNYLFIVDYGNNRIVGSGSNGFRCISGSISNMLTSPTSMAFDSRGNIYVVDQGNNRIQKFVRLNNNQTPTYNQPRFCANATWDSNGTTFVVESTPNGLFIDTNNTVYIPNRSNNRIYIWFNNDTSPTITLYGNLSLPKSLFVTMNGDIYVDNGKINGRVDLFTLNSNTSISVMSVPGNCYGLFIDISNTIYCSVDSANQVFKKWLGDNSSVITTVAGNGSNGSASNLLRSPFGIFVDTNFNLYVADYGNNRIQLFQLGQQNGITINITIALNGPIDIILDGDQYLFFSDHNNHRIIGSGPYGFRCIIGCSNSSGAATDQLNKPRSIAFDSFGNLFVVDSNNNRTQKFRFLTASCGDEITTQLLNTTTSSLMNNIISSASSCNLLNPCENQGTCLDNTTSVYGYSCLCKSGFNGANCQNNQQICKSSTCWNNGTCNQTSNTTFVSLCQSDWSGEYCQNMIDHCQNITCENNGICLSVFKNYTCQCLDTSYSGRYCEIDNTNTAVLKMISKSVAYVVIVFFISAALYIVIMDILKYYFGIDLAKVKPSETQKKKKHRPVIHQFIYIVDKSHLAELQRTTKKT